MESHQAANQKSLGTTGLGYSHLNHLILKFEN